jgi:hypothetical protein
MNITALGKPRQTWCVHCEINVGCKIYAERPNECAQFYCLYRVSPELGEEWRPADCGMVLNYEPHIKRVNVSVDGATPGAWRREPYYSQIKAMALHMLRQQGHLLVWEPSGATAIMPDRDVPVGNVEKRVLLVRGRATAQGEEYDILVVDPDDPRVTPADPSS